MNANYLACSNRLPRLSLIQARLTLSMDLDYQEISIFKTNFGLTRIFKHGFQLAIICQPTERHARKPWTNMDLKHTFVSTKNTWRHDMETLVRKKYLFLVDSLHKWEVMKIFDVAFVASLYRLLGKRLSCRWFETPRRSHHCYDRETNWGWAA